MSKNNKDTNIEIPIACLLPKDELTQRREQVHREVFSGITTTQELADGYELVFPSDAAWLTRLTEFVSYERVCCPFLTFELLMDPNQAPLRLRIRGSEEIKTFLESELDLTAVRG